MRKERNKARLRNERNSNPPPQRQKTEEDRFISIRTTWGPQRQRPQERTSVNLRDKKLKRDKNLIKKKKYLPM